MKFLKRSKVQNAIIVFNETFQLFYPAVAQQRDGMPSKITDQLALALSRFDSASRLYAFTLSESPSDSSSMLVEAFVGDDHMQGISGRQVIALSNAFTDTCALLGKTATLHVSLADGTRTKFEGDISEVAMLGSDGGFTRYRLKMSPWIWRLSQVRNSRVWQDEHVTQIVNSVFERYGIVARWRWSDDAAAFMDEVSPRSYCCQYRESDLDFVQRLLTEEGLTWRVEQTADGHGLVIFADSTQLSAVPDDMTSAETGGVRFHNARAGESQDTVQSLVSQRTLSASLTTLLTYDYKSKQAMVASSPSNMPTIAKLPLLESFDVPGQYAFSSADQGQRYSDLQMQGREARAQLWSGRSTVRTLRAGTRLMVRDTPLGSLPEQAGFTVLRVVSVGVNNLPEPAQQALSELFGPLPELLEEIGPDYEADALSLVLKQAHQSGYANCFDAISNSIPWRPQLSGSVGRSHPVPTAPGSQSAIVVGPDGNDVPSGADEIHCDRLGRVRIRFHWQSDRDAACWVRVAQRSAGGGMGSQFLPRIGQEVLVQFLEGDIDRPVIIGALYNGQGEGGTPPSPGGRKTEEEMTQPFQKANDHKASGQGNAAGGNSSMWHGASADSVGHNNSAAILGVRSKEFGGAGYNQLLFDDTDAQGRVQLKSTHGASELSLGHLIHSADNYRGSFRGTGIELRTDFYGGVRAGAGLLVSSYKVSQNSQTRDPAGDNSAGIAMLKQAVKLGEAFSEAAGTHQAVSFASHMGGVQPNESVINSGVAPLNAVLGAVSGMVSTASIDAAFDDASRKNTGAANAAIPHVNDAIIAIAARAGLGVIAGQSLQFASGETVAFMSGGDTHLATASQLRTHSGQAIGMLAGAVAAGEGGVGLQLIGAQGEVEFQAQADALKIQARDDISVMSANAHIDWAAEKSISLSTAGGANITISGGNIVIQCPGKLVVRAGKKSFDAPERTSFPLPSLPRSICVDCMRKARAAGSPFTLR